MVRHGWKHKHHFLAHHPSRPLARPGMLMLSCWTALVKLRVSLGKGSGCLCLRLWLRVCHLFPHFWFFSFWTALVKLRVSLGKGSDCLCLRLWLRGFSSFSPFLVSVRRREAFARERERARGIQRRRKPSAALGLVPIELTASICDEGAGQGCTFCLPGRLLPQVVVVSTCILSALQPHDEGFFFFPVARLRHRLVDAGCSLSGQAPLFLSLSLSLSLSPPELSRAFDGHRDCFRSFCFFLLLSPSKGPEWCRFSCSRSIPESEYMCLDSRPNGAHEPAGEERQAVPCMGGEPWAEGTQQSLTRSR